MLKVGITGGIGAGKSVVCQFFALLGIPVYDSDARAKWVMQHDVVLKNQILAAFGPEAFTTSGHLDRAYLGAVVFHQPEKLTLLNSLVHPRVKVDFENWSAAQARVPYVLKEAALMFESEAHKQVQQIITVSAPLDVRVVRVLQRDPHRQAADVHAIIEKQLPEAVRQQRADFILDNNDHQLIIPQILALHKKLVSLGKAL
ncbi:MAG: dephospho-CoA kinase [Cytophagales bacterium CG18_big_fil_WC_8_21_14_2_50_42_9]|nr:MAG: dephospho-CoA kinase [Cytophagales bacterium CG18_big_fil_WC_8_21_14_2_50_42_9]